MADISLPFIYILGLITFIVIKVYRNRRKTDELISQLYLQISYLRQYIWAKELGDEEEVLRLKNKIWMADLRKSYPMDKYGDPLDWKWVNEEEGK